jgi:hypothetical protein
VIYNPSTGQQHLSLSRIWRGSKGEQSIHRKEVNYMDG